MSGRQHIYAMDRASNLADTLVGLARQHADRAGDKTAYRFVHCAEPATELNYQQVDSAAKGIAAWLQDSGRDCSPVLLLLPTGPGFVSAFFGCQYAGVPAVPVATPRTASQWVGLRGIMDCCGTRTVVSHSSMLERMSRRDGFERATQGIDWVLLDKLETDPSGWRAVDVAADDIAVLQFTSGSTGKPKGVVITHACALANQHLIEQGFQHARDAVVVGWLPLFHDMGLFGNMLNPFHMQRPCILMPPQVFLRQPRVWLETISSFSATTSGGPNFAFEMCVQRIDGAIDDLDLSHWRVAFVGAEPVRAGTLERFTHKFAPAGFKRTAFYPCYGLAEATLIVTGEDRSAGRSTDALPPAPQQAADTVPCGVALGGQTVRIVDPETRRPCAPGETGEVWIAGPCVAAGYYGNDSATQAVFNGRLAGNAADGEASGPYLRTGDIGLLDDGQLCLRGRLKDIIIINGINVYAEDIEGWLEGAHADLAPGALAAFPISVQRCECLAVVAEVRRERRRDVDGQAVADRLRAVLARHTDVPLSAVLLCNAGAIPRTSSGKLQHWQCGRLFSGEDAPLLFRSIQAPVEAEAENTQPATALAAGADAGQISDWLRQRIAALTGQQAAGIGGSAAFAELGIDSRDALKMTTELGEQLRVTLDDTLFWEYPNIDEAAAYLAALPAQNSDQ